MPETIVTRILRLPGYGVYAWDAEATTGTLTLWVRQTAREPFYVCGGCGISVRDVHSWTERRLRDLPWGTWQVWLVLEIHRVRCRRCGVRTERVAFVEGKAHATTRLAQAVAQACEAAPVSRVAAQWGLAPQTARRLDQRVLRQWAAGRARTPLRYLEIDEIYLGRRDKFLTVVSDLERGEPLWVGLERKRETLDRFFAEALPARRRRAVRAVCGDMWKPFTQSLRTHLPHARIVYDKECATAHSLSYGECPGMCHHPGPEQRALRRVLLEGDIRRVLDAASRSPGVVRRPRCGRLARRPRDTIQCHRSLRRGSPAAPRRGDPARARARRPPASRAGARVHHPRP